ncbi:MAG: phytase [Gaiellales bacterium]
MHAVVPTRRALPVIAGLIVAASLPGNVLGVPAGGTGGPRVVVPNVETTPVPNAGDAADDPAIWVYRNDPARSTVIGTDKRGGLAVYDLSGRELQYLSGGRMNNVDLRRGFRLGGRKVTLVAADDRARDVIELFRVDPATRRLVRIGGPRIEAGVDVYGLCMYRSPAGRYYVFVTSERGEVEQWRLRRRGQAIAAERARRFDAGSQVEGCVADDDLGHLYVAEESTGIWKYGAEPGDGRSRRLVDGTEGRGHLIADVEGLAIAYEAGGTGYLLASSQGDDSFVVYRREGANAFVQRFRIGAGAGIDDVEDTDGIEVTTASLGPGFPSGLFVAQDGDNDDANQNFKLVRLERILD